MHVRSNLIPNSMDFILYKKERNKSGFRKAKTCENVLMSDIFFKLFIGTFRKTVVRSHLGSSCTTSLQMRLQMFTKMLKLLLLYETFTQK